MAASASTEYLLGCSGYYYKDWKGIFYPEDLAQKNWLPFYAQSFRTVEINNSFYRMPKESVMRGWYEKSPHNFGFAIKGSRYTTHMKKLRYPEESVGRLYQVADQLKEKLYAVLWQLPANFHCNIERLEEFCKVLKPEYHNTIEFRHSSWWNPAVYQVLRRHKVAFCVLSAPDNLPDELVETADFAYIRFHGVKEWYHYLYSAAEMKHWAGRIKTLKSKKVFIYFNNDYYGNAVENGKQLIRLLNE